MATTNTAPADTSFAIFAFSFFSGITISTIVSIDVLNSSLPITIANKIELKIAETINVKLTPAP